MYLGRADMLCPSVIGRFVPTTDFLPNFALRTYARTCESMSASAAAGSVAAGPACPPKV